MCDNYDRLLFVFPIAALLALSHPQVVASPFLEHTHGPKQLLYIVCQYPSQSSPPTSAASAKASLAQVASYFFAESRQQTSLTYEVTDPIVLSQTPSYYQSIGLGQLYTDAVELARTAGWDADYYDFVFIRHSGGPGGIGVGSTGQKGAWVQTDLWNVLAHELGHNYGLDHANGWRSFTSEAYGPGEVIEYGDPYDLMGPNRGSFSPWEHSVLQWLPESAIHRITTNGIYRLYALDVAPFVINRLYTLVVRKDVREYWLDYRGQIQGGAYSSLIQNGLLLRWAKWSQSRGGSTLIDLTPGTPGGFEDGSLSMGRTFTDPEAGVHITVVNRSPTPGQWLDVMIQFSGQESNRVPVANMAASKLTAVVGEGIAFSIFASDPDGDMLAYGWETSVDGNATPFLVSSNSPLLTYSWSAPGRYEVTCRVSDGKGGLARAGVIVTIGNPSSFAVEGVVVDSDGVPVPDVRVFGLPTGVSIDNGGYVTNPNYRADWTDGNGRFHLLNVLGGPVTVRAMPMVSRTFGMTNGNGQIDVAFDQTNLVFVASNKPRTYVKGFVRDESRVISNIVLHLGPFLTASAFDGSFTFSNIPPGAYTLTASGVDQYVCRNNPVYVDGVELTNVLMERALYRVQGSVPPDLGLIFVSTGDGKRRALARPDFEDPLGPWKFEMMLPRGRWNLEATLSGYTLVPAGFTNPIVVQGVDLADYEFNGGQSYVRSNLTFVALPGTFSIKGAVTYGGMPLSGVKVLIGDAHEWTDDSGFYRFAGLPAGSYVVSAIMDGFDIEPAGFSNPVQVGPNAANINLVATTIGPPIISSHPQTQLATISSNASFSVVATGAPPLAYQWYFNGTNLIGGATNSSFTLANVQDTDAGAYRVVVSNGAASVSSSNATLTINHPPQVPSPVLERLAITGAKARLADFLGADPDGDFVTLVSVGPASAQGGTVVTNSGWVVYSPPAGHTNSDSFPFVLSDGRGGIAQGTAVVNVTSNNVVPENFRAELLPDGSVRLSFDGIPGRVYSIEFTSDLQSPNWQTLAVVAADAFGRFVHIDLLPPGAPQRFYRASWP